MNIDYESLYNCTFLQVREQKAIFDKEKLDLLKRHNALALENIHLEAQNEKLRQIDKCSCVGWQIAAIISFAGCVGLVIYINLLT